MIDEDDILLVSDTQPEQNRKSAGYVNTDGMQQAAVPGNKQFSHIKLTINYNLYIITI